jgi:hypothetical protein
METRRGKHSVSDHAADDARAPPLSRATMPTSRNRKERRCANIASPKHRTREARPSYS